MDWADADVEDKDTPKARPDAAPERRKLGLTKKGESKEPGVRAAQPRTRVGADCRQPPPPDGRAPITVLHHRAATTGHCCAPHRSPATGTAPPAWLPRCWG